MRRIEIICEMLDIDFDLSIMTVSGNRFRLEASRMANSYHRIITASYLVAVAIGISLLASGRLALAQNLFVTGRESGYIYEFKPNGNPLGDFAAGFSFPDSLAFDSGGDLFLCDDGSGNIYEFTPNGTRSTFATGLRNPEGLAFNNSGDLFVADYDAGNIYQFTPNGTRSTFASGLVNPEGLAFNSSGDLFEADSGSGNIYEFTRNGTRSTYASGLGPAEGLTFNSSGDLFVSSGYGYFGSIFEITSSGTKSTFATGLANPAGLAFNSSGDLFEADFYSGKIYEFTPNGTRSTFASGLGNPKGLAFAPAPSWASAANGNWSNSSNWTGSVPNGVGVGAAFNVPTTAAITVTLDTPVTLSSLQFGNSASTSVGYTLRGSGSNTLTLNNSGNGATITVTDGTHAINAPVILDENLTVTTGSNYPWTLSFGTASSITDSGAGYSLTMSGTGGTLILSGSDSYTGGTFVAAGTLEVTTGAALPAGTSLTIGAGGTFIFDPTATAASSPSLAVSAVPEPSTFALLGVGAVGLLDYVWRRRKKSR